MGSPTPPRRQTDAAGRASRRGAQLRKSGASGAAQLRRPGTRGEREKRPGQPRAGLTWLAGGGRPPSRGRGALTTCCLSPAEHPRRAGPSFLLRLGPRQPRSLRGRPREGRAGAGRGRRSPGGRAAPRPGSPRGSGSPAAARAERWGGARGAGAHGRRSRSDLPLAGEARSASSPPPPGPPLACPLPSRPPGPGADAARALPAGTLPARGAGRGRGPLEPGSPPTSPPSTRAASSAPRAPSPLLLSSHRHCSNARVGWRQTD